MCTTFELTLVRTGRLQLWILVPSSSPRSRSTRSATPLCQELSPAPPRDADWAIESTCTANGISERPIARSIAHSTAATGRKRMHSKPRNADVESSSSRGQPSSEDSQRMVGPGERFYRPSLPLSTVGCFPVAVVRCPGYSLQP